MTLSALRLQRCQWALRGGKLPAAVGALPRNLRIAPQCSLPFEKGSRIASLNFVVTVRVDCDGVFDTVPTP